MKYLKTLLASILLLAVAILISSVSYIPIAKATCNTDEWCIVTSPNVSLVNNVPWDVAVIDASHVWSVGYTITGTTETAFAMRYNGSSWSTSSMSISGAVTSSLYGVAAVSSSNVWAVGEYTTSGSADRTLIMHWNGLAWSQVSSPNVNSNDNTLNAVTVVSSDDVWAVGTYTYDVGDVRSLTMHWDGSSWSIISSPIPDDSTNNILYGVTAVDSENVWASGNYYDNGSSRYAELYMRWDGTEWNLVLGADNVPYPYGSNPATRRISAIDEDDIWSVGSYTNLQAPSYRTLGEHWDGTEWSFVTTPYTTTNYSSGTSKLFGVAAVESDAVWSVGYIVTRTLTTYWDGTSWDVVDSDNVDTGNNWLYGVSVTPGGSVLYGYQAWAVGFSTDTATGLKKTLAMLFDHPALASP